MIFDDMKATVLQLEEAQKLELVQMLIDDLKLSGTSYEILTPFGNEAAARILSTELAELESLQQPEID